MPLVRIRCRLLHLQLLLLLLSSAVTGNSGDEGALLAFKAKISHHFGVLDSWNQSASHCNWEGVTCSKRHPSRVVALDLSAQGLTGTIFPAIGNLTFLLSVNLSTNALQGEIPPSIGSLRRLQRIDLSENMLTSVIPSNISLREMYIFSNKGLQGSIPAEIGNMPSLSVLMLFNCSITGTMPPSLGNISRLTKLSLSMDYPYLAVLQLSINNLSGSLPPSLLSNGPTYRLSIYLSVYKDSLFLVNRTVVTQCSLQFLESFPYSSTVFFP
ncbi:LRR receptor-like serine/threonine-protein kinase EFR [Miscanthus floridulus]|uniref:LRR receptor-like serine/threonine-protein kinase EFR n=1 Tax=Miscanthus floridulus TaxID=154761 RepID=UPI00345875BD